MALKQESLKKAIDQMVAESIRRQLPQIMAEVLVKTVAEAGVVREVTGALRGAPVQEALVQPRPAQAKRQRPPSLSNLRELLDEEAGAEFYSGARPEDMALTDEDVMPPQESSRPLAARINSLPPQLRHLAEGLSEEDLDDSDDVSLAGLDFSGAKRMLGLMEGTAKVSKDDALREAQFKAQMLEHKRRQLEVKPT